MAIKQLNNEIISVIVPVYNVEEYLRECIESIIIQIYSNLEIILVDDGSTDNSGIICDEYAEIDYRIRVIHKQNGGLSSARNIGIQSASGEYIGFVDSDDIIDQDMFSEMISAAKNYNADIVICGIQYFKESVLDTLPCVHSSHVVAASGNKRFEFIIDPNGMGDFAVNKIYRKNLFLSGILFPEDHIFEDIFTSYKLFSKAKKVVCLNEDYYYYRLRSGSVSHSVKYNPKMIDIVVSTKEQLEFIKQIAPEYLPFAYQKNLDANIIELNHLYENRRLSSEKELVRQIKRNIEELLLEGFIITRFEMEAKSICKGILFWKYCYRMTKVYNCLDIHPKCQKIWHFVFKRHIFLEK